MTGIFILQIPPFFKSQLVTCMQMYLNMCTRIWLLSCWCVCVALTIFRMATYQFNMLHSPPDSVPVLHHGLSLHSQWLQHGACDTKRRAALLCDIFLPLYAWSSGTFIKQRGRNAQTTTTSLNSEILSYSFERSGSTHHIYLEEANWFNLPCLHHA